MPKSEAKEVLMTSAYNSSMMSRLKWSSANIIPIAFVSMLCTAHAQVNPGSGAGLVAPALSAPANSPAGAPSNPQSSIVATVNGQSITMADINVITSRALQGVTDPAIIARVKTQALNDLMNEYLASSAFEKNLTSQNPEAVKQLERLKRQVVMNFYLSSNLSDMPKPDPRKIDSYLQKHPELVAVRQTFHFSQILIDTSKSVDLAQVQGLVNQDPALNMLIAWLQDNKVPSIRNRFWKGTEQLNPATVATLNGLKKGGISVEQSKDQKGIAVIKLIEAYPDPVSVEEARATIATSAEGEMRNQIARDLLIELRSKADIKIFDQNFDKVDQLTALNPKSILDEPKIHFLNKILIIWFFSLIVLVPAAVAVFYRQRTTFEMNLDLLPKALMEPEFLEYQKYTKLTRQLIVILLLLPVLYWLCMPLFDFFRYPPAEIGFQVIALLALAGFFFGGVVVLACFKVPQIYLRMKSGWLGLAILMGIELIFFWFGIHA